jgi:hypothetical protein
MTSPIDRAELERLDRDTLIARAESAGVSRANILTRPELVDELLLRTSKKDDPGVSRARGFFGRARDLLARVIERGLHLPDAAELLRRAGSPPPPRRTAPAAVPTVTLAEIYATQGHRARAIETLQRVLDHEPDHAAARSLLTQLSSAVDPERARGAPQDADPASDGAHPERTRAASPGASDSVPSEPPEPFGFLDDDTLPARYDVDECVAVSVDPTTLFTYWEVRDSTLAHLRRTRPEGKIGLRVLIVTPSWDGPMSSTRDIDVGQSLGDWFVHDLPAGAVVRVAIGWRSADAFLPIAHSPALETPFDKPNRMPAYVWARWTPRGPVAVAPAEANAEWGVDARESAGTSNAWWSKPRPANGTRGGAAKGTHVWSAIGAAPVEGPQGSSEHAVPV